MTLLLAFQATAQDATRDDEWAYVTGAYVLVVLALVAYAGWTIIRGRRVGRRLPPEDRRWM